MTNNVFKKSLAIGIIILFLGASFTPVIMGNIDNIQISDKNSESLSDTDWWPMFRHGLDRSGFSTSSTPNVNRVLWRYATEDIIESSPAVVDGKVYIGSNDQRVYCLDAGTGVKIWDFQTNGAVSSSPAVIDGKVYIGTYTKVYCLDAATGGSIWIYYEGTSGSPAVADGKVYVDFGSRICCLDADNGMEIWDLEINGSTRSSPAVVDGKVYVGESGGWVYCLDADTGGNIWDFYTGRSACNAPAVVDTKVYIGTTTNESDAVLYCLNADTGMKIWDFQKSNNQFSSPAVANGKVYIGSRNQRVYCLDADTGENIWEFKTEGNVRSSPAVANGKVFIGSEDDSLYCLDADTGSKIWGYIAGNYVDSSPAVANGKIYFGSYDKTIYCIGGEENIILYVGGTGPGNYSSIQNAINDAADGDTVFVYDDSSPYYENIVINHPLNLIGENKYTTIIESPTGDSDQIVEIISSWVNISGFTIQNNSKWDGIRVHGQEILYHYYNIYIFGNIIQNNYYLGISAEGIEYSNISNNIVTNNRVGNINLYYSSNNTVYGNICTNSSSLHHHDHFSNGIACMDFSSNNILYGNIIKNNYLGIWIYDQNSENNTLLENYFENNTIAVMDGPPPQTKLQKVFSSDLTKKPTVIMKNNFIKNKYVQVFTTLDYIFDIKTIWDKNYWGRSLIFPKIIIGFLLLPIGLFFPGNFKIDWHPAKEPYDIPSVV